MVDLEESRVGSRPGRKTEWDRGRVENENESKRKRERERERERESTV